MYPESTNLEGSTSRLEYMELEDLEKDEDNDTGQQKKRVD